MARQSDTNGHDKCVGLYFQIQKEKQAKKKGGGEESKKGDTRLKYRMFLSNGVRPRQLHLL